ncbi:uncharacterized protein GGS25DRAFT_503230 [Hypoxylon fragiforme]|uniref:uncharacterized protein n=1 Tax=Hypoxylon fragiforme TaxID=63214 RepID=UPI0020C74535|nr:uncharacterized protein GGS25DRAFT_503230 [Hypoxylon fragiforme]KAI2605035.1 hypothetical protein GGS25DRAFT_503230 [Hypoxylon fragiforme]
MTNLGPLTTIFTPSGPDCASTFAGFVDDNAWIQYGVGGSASSACLPPNFRPVDPYYYSPGICPSGYTTACNAQISPSTGTLVETVATCCPSSYSCRDSRGNDPFGCLSCFTGWETFSVSTFFFSTNSDGSTTRIDAGTTTATWSSNCVRAYAPIVHVASGDVLITGSTDLPASTGSGSSIPTATGSTSTADETDSPKLSAGAAAGIGVGCGLVTIGLIGVMVFVLMRRRRRRLQANSTDETSRVDERDKPHPELLVPPHPPTYELDPFQELPRQLDSFEHPRYELNAESK